MKILSAAEMKSMDRQATERFGVPGCILMENAGRESVELLRALSEDGLTGLKTVILAGKGNNGGDGLVIARHLLNAGACPQVWLMAEASELAGDAKLNADILAAMGESVYPLQNEQQLAGFTHSLLDADYIIDALYGIGFKGRLSELESRAVELINATAAIVVAIDIPSGMEADSGTVYDQAVRADFTVSFACPKRGFFKPFAADYLGRVLIADISIPPALREDEQFPDNLITESKILKWFAPRRPEGHKGSYGHLLVVGASDGMSGAVAMTCQAALRTGAGLVTAAVPQSLVNIIDNAAAELMCRGLPETRRGAAISSEALPALENLLGTSSVCVIGPGMSRYREANAILSFVLKHSGIPVLIDADGLNALEGDTAILEKRQVPLILTPHPGEMARLTGLSVRDIQGDRLGVAREYAQKWGVILVLKGQHTIVANPHGATWLNPTGNPGMATAGSGDVLSGVIGGLTAQGLKPLDAAIAGVYLHGLAGDHAAAAHGQRGLIAGDIIAALPTVISELESRYAAPASGSRFYWV
ncbi:MAG: NAD(P)H-hydrate dehydratase [Syntrophomonadaceae bacterium]|nr:NAD(P)H-hydrate dehydratase [Syntrophomonadaceae bacterium]